MASFNNLASLEKYLQENVQSMLKNSADVERVLADEMAQAVVKHVYDVYEPKQYKRRENEESLSDTRNMEVMDVVIEGNQVKLTFMNTALGQDSMDGMYIGGLIEHGAGSGNGSWNDDTGAWALPRPFTKETAIAINNNPEYLIGAIKKGLQEAGMKFK